MKPLVHKFCRSQLYIVILLRHVWLSNVWFFSEFIIFRLNSQFGPYYFSSLLRIKQGPNFIFIKEVYFVLCWLNPLLLFYRIFYIYHVFQTFSSYNEPCWSAKENCSVVQLNCVFQTFWVVVFVVVMTRMVDIFFYVGVFLLRLFDNFFCYISCVWISTANTFIFTINFTVMANIILLPYV